MSFISSFLLGFGLGGLGYLVDGVWGLILGICLGCAILLIQEEIIKSCKK